MMKEYIIEFHQDSRPYNCRMVLSLDLLQWLARPLRQEILQGLVDSDAEGRVILNLHLDLVKIQMVQDLVRDYEKEASRRRA
jgi:hypothetical protein